MPTVLLPHRACEQTVQRFLLFANIKKKGFNSYEEYVGFFYSSRARWALSCVFTLSLCMRRGDAESTVLADQLLILSVGALLNPSVESSYQWFAWETSSPLYTGEQRHNCRVLLGKLNKRLLSLPYIIFLYLDCSLGAFLRQPTEKLLRIWFSLLWFGLWCFHTLISSKMIAF